MKLALTAMVGLLGFLVPGAVADAQPRHRPPAAWHAPGHPAHVAAPWQARLARSAHAMADRAAHVARTAHRVAPHTRLERRAHAFARQARVFHRRVETGAHPRLVRAELRPLRRSLRQLERAAVRTPRVDPRWLQRDLAALTQSLHRTADLARLDVRRAPRRIEPRRRRAPRYQIRIGL